MSMGAPHRAGSDCACLALQVNEGWKSLRCTEAFQLTDLELTAYRHGNLQLTRAFCS